MKLTRPAVLLLIPGFLVLTLFLLLPLGNVLLESTKQYIPGGIGGKAGTFTIANYFELFHPVYLNFLYEMIWMCVISTTAGVAVAFPIGYFVARRKSGRFRTIAIGFLVGMLFLSVLVRVYSIELAFGPVGLGVWLSRVLGVSTNSTVYTQVLVIIGLMHHNVPLSALILVGTIQNVNPRLADAAQALGAPRWRAHLAITVPLSVRGVLSAVLINFSIALSAFINPWVLGKGKVLFMSNLIYNRFGEAANYPSGSAISIQLLLLSLAMIYVITVLTPTRWGKA